MTRVAVQLSPHMPVWNADFGEGLADGLVPKPGIEADSPFPGVKRDSVKATAGNLRLQGTD